MVAWTGYGRPMMERALCILVCAVSSLGGSALAGPPADTLRVEGGYSFELSDGTTREGGYDPSAVLVRPAGDHPELVELVVFLDGLDQTTPEDGRLRLDLSVEVGTGRMEGVLRVPIAPGQDSNDRLWTLAGEAALSAGRLRLEFAGTDQDESARASGVVEVLVGERTPADFEPPPAQISELRWDIPCSAGSAEGQAGLTVGVPRGWAGVHGRSSDEYRHGLALYKAGLGRATLSGEALEREAASTAGRYRAYGEQSSLSQVGPDRWMVRAEGGPTDPPSLHGYVGWPDQGFYAALHLYDVPDLEAWVPWFEATVATVKPRCR